MGVCLQTPDEVFDMQSVVIVGAGQAGGWAAKTLRDQNYTGKIVLVGDEQHPPYERPPLSKDVLLGTRSPESTYLWTATKLTELNIDLMLECSAVSIDRQSKTVTLSNGHVLRYDRLMLTTGSRVRRLSTVGAELPRIHYMRGINDTVAISQALVSGSRLLVVGGGWIGLEIAAAARQRNIEVILVEASRQLCSRVLPADVALYLQQQHERQGVRVLLNTSVAEFRGKTHFESALLSTGDQITADTAVVGVGVVPNSEIASESGLETNNGIVVDASGQTSDNSIYAAGDVANQPDGAGRRVRLESWSNAQNQSIVVAKALLGADSVYQDVPYFWSDQYEIKLQILGDFAGYDNIVRRGNEDSQFTSFYLKGNKIIAVVGINRSQDIAIARRLMQKNVAVDRQRLVSAGALNEILRAPTPP
jgi:3-phenylpropionate/trans-cinnamate dioxygenase ferredoxin reductase subunit